MFSSSKQSKKSGGASLSTITSQSNGKPKQGRERLKYFADGIANANAAVGDLQERIARFENIIADAQIAQKALQAVINNDSGRSLSAFSAGATKPTDQINVLVAAAKTSREASIAATEALPYTRSLLDDARSQLATLSIEKALELNKVVARLADVDAQAYWQAFQNLGRLHDQLVGFATCAGQNLMAGEATHVRLTTEPLSAPRFIMPSLGSEDSDPELRYQSNHFAQEEAARKWSAVRERLNVDDQADINDLLLKATKTPTP
jgi:hypothetical protein